MRGIPNGPVRAFAEALDHPLGALRAIVLAAILTTVALAPATQAAGLTPRVSLPLIEREAMCVTCKVALNESQSPQANLERAYIKELIAQGDDEAEIKRSLVAQYGPTVLGLPSAHGFDLAVYLVPAAVVLALLGGVLALLPNWRRRARRERPGGPPGTPGLSSTDAARLESDLARFD
jgi:cytochrome c-type biogenesis protein CcmH/NrfF